MERHAGALSAVEWASSRRSKNIREAPSFPDCATGEKFALRGVFGSAARRTPLHDALRGLEACFAPAGTVRFGAFGRALLLAFLLLFLFLQLLGGYLRARRLGWHCWLRRTLHDGLRRALHRWRRRALDDRLLDHRLRGALHRRWRWTLDDGLRRALHHGIFLARSLFTDLCRTRGCFGGGGRGRRDGVGHLRRRLGWTLWRRGRGGGNDALHHRCGRRSGGCALDFWRGRCGGRGSRAFHFRGRLDSWAGRRIRRAHDCRLVALRLGNDRFCGRGFRRR